MPNLSQLRVAVIASDGFEELELTQPIRALRQAGATVDILADHEGEIQGYRGESKTVQVPITRELGHQLALPELYDALLLPGGHRSIQRLMKNPAVLGFVSAMDGCEKPIAMIGHGPLLLLAAGQLNEREITGHPEIRTQLEQAGGVYQDREVVAAGNWIASRQVTDIPAFNREIIDGFARLSPLLSHEGRRAPFRANTI